MDFPKRQSVFHSMSNPGDHGALTIDAQERTHVELPLALAWRRRTRRQRSCKRDEQPTWSLLFPADAPAVSAKRVLVTGPFWKGSRANWRGWYDNPNRLRGILEYGHTRDTSIF